MGARIGVIGLGRIGSYHARNLLTMDGVDALIVTDVDARRTSDVASELDVGVRCRSRRAFSVRHRRRSDRRVVEFARRPDRSRCPPRHPDVLRKAGSRPIESSVRVLATAEQTSVPVQIGFQRRFDPSFVAAYDAVRSENFGWIRDSPIDHPRPRSPPISYIAHSGGIFRDCSIHDFDIVRWVSGRVEVTTVFATGSNQGDRGIADAGDVDTAATVLTFEGGTIAVVSNTRYNGRGMTADSRYSARRTPSLPGWTTACHPLSRPRSIVPLEGAVHVLHDRFTSAYRAELGSIPRRCRRASGITVHAHRCGRVGVDLRSRNALSARGSARHDHRSQRSVPSRQE